MSGFRTLRVGTVLSVAALAGGLAAGGCGAPPRSCADIESLVASATRRAAVAADGGSAPEAWQLATAAHDLDPNHPGLPELRSRIDAGHEDLFDRDYLGSNYRQRPQADRWLVTKVLLYLPDRVLDILDVFSFDVHFGIGALANVHLTRAVQGGAGLRSVGGIGWHEHRSLGLQSQSEIGVVLPAAGTQAYGGMILGTSGIIGGSDGLAGLHRPSAPIYQEYRDYWAVGAAVTAGIVGVDFDFHPVQLVDALVGFTTIDMLNDDFARTRGLALNDADRYLVRQIREVTADRDEVARYADWIARGRPAGE